MKKRRSFSIIELLTVVCIFIIVIGLVSSTTEKFTYKDRIVITLKNINDKMSDIIAMYKGYDEPVADWGWNEPNSHEISQNILKKYILPHFDKHLLCSSKPLYCVGGYRTLDGEDYINFRGDDEYARALIGKNDVHIALATTGSCDKRSKKSLCGTLTVDIDNKGGENRLGYDVFIFGFYADGTFAPLGINLSDEKIEAGCTKEAPGDTCAAKILKDGWIIKQIGKNAYPVELQ